MAFSKRWQGLNPWARRHALFSPVQSDEPYQDEPFLASKEESGQSSSRERRSKLNNPWVWTTINVAILTTTVIANSMHLIPFRRTLSQDGEWPAAGFDGMSDAVRATSSYSPILKDMEVDVHDVYFNGSLWPDKDPSWMRAEPGPETDAIWAEYEPVTAFWVTGDDVRAMGVDPADVVRFPDEVFGLGDDAYMASFDMLHKAHCLNELRKMTFEDYKEAAPVKTKRHGRLWWVHLRHCVDMLMQDQLCHADADVILYQWVDTRIHPWPQLGVKRRCRNWDQIYRWGADRFVDMDKIVARHKPASGIREFPHERGYYETYGFNDSTMFPNGEGYEW